ncbi:ribosomal protein L7/L12 [Mycobacterium sp. URHB0044]|uniref:ribosomal protein L7/L12 n=1 Tax=Mycobacterium sp. URHB0044 TaxID=1380386 RepID=UPI00048C7238|nr:ribosomal protein L7/L12 [Mycobacterium sp. URHB0044]
MALFGSSDDDLARRVEQLEQRVVALERALAHAGIERAVPRPAGEFSDGWISDEVRSLAASGKKIEAIKVLREQTGLGLKESKDAVERL